MDYRKLGSAGIKVSPLCLGTMMFGAWGNTDRKDCIAIIQAAIDAGINFIDTANRYAEGESEAIVGEALRGRREEVVLATKVCLPMGEGPNQRGLSRKHIQEQAELSLRRLGVETIDLYQIHRPDPATPWEETLRALDDLVRAGKVRYLGCSTNHYDPPGEKHLLPAWEIVETLWLADRRGWDRFVCLQPPYSMLRRVMEREHFPMTRRFGIANIVWSPLEGGFLAGKYRKGRPNPADTTRARKWVGPLDSPKFTARLDAVERLLGLASECGVPLSRLALAWALREPAVTSAIIGPRTREQLDDCLASLDVTISDETAARIDAIVAPGTTVL